MLKKRAAATFPILCIGGASANLAAYTGLFNLLRPDLGIAVVIVNHLPLVNGLLLEALPSVTTMPVKLIEDGEDIQANHIFIAEAERDLHVLNGKFHVTPTSKPTGWPDVITVFLRSLAKHWPGQLIVVIYSGYDGDGAAALLEVREAGGIVMAQKAETASQPDMPLSAMASGCVDFVLPIEGIAREIERISREAVTKRLHVVGGGVN